MPKDKGLTIGKVYAEIGSGRTLRREKLTLVRKRYIDGVIQGVIVMMLARLTCHTPDLLTLQEEMGLHNATLYSVEETVGDLHQSILARFVEHQYREG